MQCICEYNFVKNPEEILEILHKGIKWYRMRPFPRAVCHYDFDNNILNNLMIEVAVYYKRNVKAVFLNLYENGKDYTPYHKDSYNCDMFLLSLGEERTLRYKHDNTGENIDFVLKGGCGVYILKIVNNEYKHTLTKTTKKNCKKRISALFFFDD